MARHVVQVVHCVDTEGPLFEPLSATFQRLKSIFGFDFKPSLTLLRRLQNGQEDLGGLEQDVARVVSPQLLGYNSDWGMVDAMLERIMAPDFRLRQPDSFGGGWVYNWHCVDHIGYQINPRRRDLGFHNIFDAFRQKIAEPGSERDALHFHFHPMPFSRRANHNASHWFANGLSLYEILARRIIERNWFPSVNRPGFHVERADSHWFLEQFIPFDYANQATTEGSAQKDKVDGRFGDWRRAPLTWQPYHPSHDDYQVPGQCRRWIMRCLNVGTRAALLTQTDVDDAFAQAEAGLPAILSITNHEFRDMAPDVDLVRTMLADAARRFPQVDFRYCEAREAVRLALGLDDGQGQLSLSLDGNCLQVRADRPTFGPQPFLALRTKGGQFTHDNLDIQEPHRHWTYVLDEQTVDLAAIDRVGVGSAFANGSAATAVLDPQTGGVVTAQS